MNNASKLCIYSKLAALQEQAGKLAEDIGTDSPDVSVMQAATRIHDISAELYDLTKSFVVPPGAYAFQGDAVVLEDDVAPGSSRDQANQQLSPAWEELARRSA